MARSMSLAHEPSYRAVVLRRYKPDVPSHFDRTVKVYTDADDNDYPYHRGSAYGPYSTPSQAKAAMTREVNDIKRGFGNYIAEIDAFAEETTAVWTRRN
jgi:hypothetical protein